VAKNPENLGSRYIGLAATATLVFSITILPFVGPLSLILAVQQPFSQLLQAVVGSRYPDPLPAVSVAGFLLIVLGSFAGLVFFGFRYSKRGARAGILTSAVGLLLVTAALFDYQGDFISKIFTIIYVGVWPSLQFYGTGYFISWLALIIGLIATTRPRKMQPQRPTRVTQTVQVAEKLMPTGYTALDNILYGGLFPGSSVVLTGPPCDEKNMIVRRFIETTLASGRGCVLISNSIDRVGDLLSKYGKQLQVILCHPQADTIAALYPEVVKLRSVDNLTEINLEFNKAFAKPSSGKPPVLCLEILDDVLLDHHGATRRWLMDVLGRSKSNEITSLVTLNPAMHPVGELQAVLETFDGHIDLYEAELHVRPKLIRVRKLGGRKFLDNELLVEREKI
jgi:KaiC/GvpD/RAD55 family RecA-like ATPase